MNYWKGSARIALVGLLPAAAPAQEVFVLDEITVTANREATAIERAGTNVIVMDREDLDKAGTLRLTDYLARLPGVSFTASGPLGTNAALRIRGAGPAYIAVYIDGIKVNDPSGTQVAYEFGSLTTADIEQIELLKGSQSALYGGSAVAGVINITTRGAATEGTGHSVHLEAGSYGTAVASYRLTQKTGDLQFDFSASHVSTDGFSAADENAGNTESDGFRKNRLSFGARYRVSDALTVGGSIFTEDGWNAFDEYAFGIGPVDGTPGDDFGDTDQIGARVFAEMAAGGWDHTLSLSGYRIERSNVSLAQPAFLSYSNLYTGRRLDFSYLASGTLRDGLDLVAGVDYMREEFDYVEYLPANTGTSGDTWTAGAFAQLLWAPSDKVDISASIRIDDHSAFGDHTTGRLSAAWRPAQDWIVRANLATGFRAPSNTELYGPFGANPALKPEESLSYDIGVERRFASGGHVAATLFALDIDNEIEYIAPPPAFIGGYVNVPGTSKRRGVELSAGLPLSDRLTLSGAYTYTDAETAAGAPVQRVPRNNLSLAADYTATDRLAFGANLQHVTGLFDSGADLPGYTVAGATVSYDLTDAAELYLRVENLFDEQYQTVRGYGTSDRSVYVGLRATF